MARDLEEVAERCAEAERPTKGRLEIPRAVSGLGLRSPALEGPADPPSQRRTAAEPEAPGQGEALGCRGDRHGERGRRGPVPNGPAAARSADAESAGSLLHGSQRRP